MSLLRKLLVENSAKPSVITYTTTDGNIITPKDGVFLDAAGNQAKVVSNTYENGQGKMEFDRAVYSINYSRDNNQWVTLKSIDLDDSIKSLNKQAFYYSKKLENIQLKSVKAVYNSCFGGCDKLSSLTLPSTVTYIYDGSIIDAVNITKIEIIENNIYKSDSNCIIEKDTKALIVGCAKSVIPDYVEKINSNAFVYQLSLTKLSIGENISQITNSAFKGCCYSLSEIIVNENNPYFYVENNCLIRKSDKTIIVAAHGAIIPEGIEVLGAYSFAMNNKIENIIIPSSIKKIEDYIFLGCENLIAITITIKVPPICTKLSFNNINNSLTKIYVPSESVDKYKTASGWSNYASLIQAMPQE